MTDVMYFTWLNLYLLFKYLTRYIILLSDPLLVLRTTMPSDHEAMDP